MRKSAFNHQNNSDSKRLIEGKKLIGLIIILVFIISILAIPLSFVATNIFNTFFYGRYNPCETLPDIETARQIVDDHQDVIDAIEKIHPDCIHVSLEERCEGKGELVIYYCTIDQQIEILKIIGNNTFFGLPFRMFNT
jgi:hypothetical protein